MKRASVLDVIRSITKTAGVGVKLTVDHDMLQVMAMKTSFIIMRVVCPSKITSPMSFAFFYSLQLLIREGGREGGGHVWHVNSRSIR